MKKKRLINLKFAGLSIPFKKTPKQMNIKYVEQSQINRARQVIIDTFNKI